ncbi:bifunctional heptose 7-phosphate kinase/heptose 1-phosphate adenyltransferase [Lewinella sp. JB7]|uniref:bifunctional heptose 7-phosphate kinase/heptose 1-phosphate adenyltransferase n=1 Tax=Lewinella sp. JB7 TaxID=2962887 RepID=UPI0020C9FB8B|nr:bifunctional ADP-heptose synthase [Lewinella sp. JB7]MCP9235427.1 bifunctional ADP-heptose synthase [Lewinella sp. JB7]
MLPDFSRLRVLVVGDIMIDRYLSGRVDRISPEAPVPVISMERVENRLGGAGNVAVNLRALGVRAGLAGAVGDDENAKLFGTLLNDHGIPDDLLIPESGRLSTVKTRIISQDQQLLRIDREHTNDLLSASVDRLIEAVRRQIDGEGCDLVLLQDYNKGVLTVNAIERLIAMAADRNIPTAVDPKHRNFWAYRGVQLFKPNLREMQQQVDFPIRPTLADLDRAAALVFERLNCRQVMITLSEHGIYTHDGSHSQIHPTHARRIADVSGAGDTVISVAASGIAAGMSLTAAARLANLAGAQVIARPGVVAVDLAELRREWSESA